MSHRILTDIILARPLGEVFELFSNAGNLEAITPPERRFQILTPLPIAMHTGARIDYRLHLYAVPLTRWTRIRDEVQYGLPFEPIGRLALPLVRARLKRIFRYREERVRALLAD